MISCTLAKALCIISCFAGLPMQISILYVWTLHEYLPGGVYGLLTVESDYDSIWYMRQDSYQASLNA